MAGIALAAPRQALGPLLPRRHVALHLILDAPDVRSFSLGRRRDCDHHADRKEAYELEILVDATDPIHAHCRR